MSSPHASSGGATGGLWHWLSQRPALLLILTTLIWGSNAVAARLAVG